MPNKLQTQVTGYDDNGSRATGMTTVHRQHNASSYPALVSAPLV